MSPNYLLSAHPLVERLGWALVHFLWQGLMIVGSYLLARTRASSPRGRYALACAALAGMVAAPICTFVLMAPAPVPATALVNVDIAAHSVLVPPAKTAPFSSLPIRSAPQYAIDPMTFLVAIWLGGVSALAIRLIGGSLFAVRLRSARCAPPPAEWQRALGALLPRVRISLPVRLAISGFVKSPAVIGYLKPVILLPASGLSGIAPEYIEALLAHELAHIRRRDYLVNVLQRIAEMLLFYHPAVWWLSNQIAAEREACCDDEAVAITGDPLPYVCALASLESARPEHFPVALAANGGPLKERVARLLGHTPPAAHAFPGSGLVTAGVLLGLGVCTLLAQTADNRPAFEVASLKTDNSRTGVDRIKRSPGSLIVENVPLKRMIGMAYGVPDGRDYLFKGPDWMDETNFDIYAKFPAPTTDADLLLMMQRLLHERFRLKLHRETHLFSVYALVAERPGPNLHPTPTPGPHKFSARNGHAIGVSVTMAQFADRLSRNDFGIGRRVVDATGLAGQYDLTLDWQPNADQPGADDDSPSIVTALARQLGLRLDPRKVSLDVLVVDAASKTPVEN